MVDERKADEYYSALEVAERHGISKTAVIDRCKLGKYPGAVKSQPDRTNKQGIWLIPKEIIDNPNTDFTPATIQQPVMDLALLKDEFRNIVREELKTILEEENKKNRQSINKLTDELESSRMTRHNNKSISGWIWLLLIVTLILGVFIFMNWTKIVAMIGG